MDCKDRDIVELEQFQLEAIKFCHQISQVGKSILANTEEAAVSLRDDVSKLSIHRIEFAANKLVNISEYGQQEMKNALNKTRNELERWNNM